MGLLDKLRAELVDIVEWVDDGRHTLVWRFPRYHNQIKNGAQLIVRPGQLAVFVREGKLADVFGPGQHRLETRNLPVLSTLAGWAKGFDSPFKAEVYFVSTRPITDLKWGTPSPVLLRDPDFGPVRVRAFGTYTLRALDPRRLLEQLVGTDSSFESDEIGELLRAIIATAFADLVAKSEIALLDLSKNYQSLSDRLRELALTRIDDEYGLEIPQLFIVNVSVPAEVEQALDARTSMNVIGDLRGVPGLSARPGDAGRRREPGGRSRGRRRRRRDGDGDRSRRCSGGAATGAPQTPPPPPAAAWWIAGSGQTQGPFTPEQLASSGRLRPDTLVWTAGMADWQPAPASPRSRPGCALPPPRCEPGRCQRALARCASAPSWGFPLLAGCAAALDSRSRSGTQIGRVVCALGISTNVTREGLHEEAASRRLLPAGSRRCGVCRPRHRLRTGHLRLAGEQGRDAQGPRLDHQWILRIPDLRHLVRNAGLPPGRHGHGGRPPAHVRRRQSRSPRARDGRRRGRGARHLRAPEGRRPSRTGPPSTRSRRRTSPRSSPATTSPRTRCSARWIACWPPTRSSPSTRRADRSRAPPLSARGRGRHAARLLRARSRSCSPSAAWPAAAPAAVDAQLPGGADRALPRAAPRRRAAVAPPPPLPRELVPSRAPRAARTSRASSWRRPAARDPQAELEATLASFFAAARRPTGPGARAVRLHRAPPLARARAGFRRRAGCPSSPARASGLVRGARSERRHLRLPGSLPEQPVVDVRTHAAAPRHRGRRGTPRPDLVGHQLRGRDRRRRRRRLRRQGACSASIPGYYSIGPYYEKVKEYGDWESRDIWEYRLDLTPRGDRADAEAPLGAPGHPPSTTTTSTRTAPGSCSACSRSRALPSDDESLPALGDPGGFAARRGRSRRGCSAQAVYRPSATTQLRDAVRQLTPQERGLALRVSDGELAPGADELAALAPQRPRRRADGRLRPAAPRADRAATSTRDATAARARAILIERSRVDVQGASSRRSRRRACRHTKATPPRASRCAAGYEDQRAFIELRAPGPRCTTCSTRRAATRAAPGAVPRDHAALVSRRTSRRAAPRAGRAGSAIAHHLGPAFPAALLALRHRAPHAAAARERPARSRPGGRLAHARGVGLGFALPWDATLYGFRRGHARRGAELRTTVAFGPGRRARRARRQRERPLARARLRAGRRTSRWATAPPGCAPASSSASRSAATPRSSSRPPSSAISAELGSVSLSGISTSGTGLVRDQMNG